MNFWRPDAFIYKNTIIPLVCQKIYADRHPFSSLVRTERTHTVPTCVPTPVALIGYRNEPNTRSTNPSVRSTCASLIVMEKWPSMVLIYTEVTYDTRI